MHCRCRHLKSLVLIAIGFVQLFTRSLHHMVEGISNPFDVSAQQKKSHPKVAYIEQMQFKLS